MPVLQRLAPRQVAPRADEDPQAEEEVMMTQQELADLAFNIADRTCADLIENCTVEEKLNGEVWLAFDDNEHGDKMQQDCEDEIDYLEARGLLHRHPERKYLVRIEEGARW
jgi:hypothetical protein